MGGAEEVKPYNEDEAKGKQVGEMFDAIAPSYDFMNTMMTGGLHKHWRNKALKMAAAAISDQRSTSNDQRATGNDQRATINDQRSTGSDQRSTINDEGPRRVLDVACGTGDVSFKLHEMFPKAHITGLDLSPGMLWVAKGKLEWHDAETQKLITFMEGDCLKMPFEDATFDMVTVAYGVRNFEKLEDGYREMRRVLKPGGVLCVIELSEPSSKPIRSLYRLYSRNVIPFVGKMVSHDTRAYSYLPESIAACPQRGEMTAMMERAGFKDARYKSLTLGVITIYLAKS